MAQAKKKTTKSAGRTSIQFEPERVILMVVILSVLTLVLYGALTTL